MMNLHIIYLNDMYATAYFKKNYVLKAFFFYILDILDNRNINYLSFIINSLKQKV